MRAELGFYTVNGTRFTNKILAILEAQKTSADIEWNFSDDYFSSANWLVEPTPTVDELYRARAQQIREAYDYVIVMCSGGADSTNVLWSFLNNGIHIDEVIGEAPMSGLSNWQWNKKDTSVDNTVSEYKFAQMPLLNEVSTKFPRVRVTLIDPFEKIHNPKEGDWLVGCQDIINPYTFTTSKLDQSNRLRNLAESGKRIAVVLGTDKPVLSLYPNGDLYTVFADMPVNLPKKPFDDDYPNVDRVLFYWGYEMPEVIIKMSHVVAKEIHKPEHSVTFKAMTDLPKKYFLNTNAGLTQDEILTKILRDYKKDYVPAINTNYNPFSVYERGIVPLIYPSTHNPQLFQADKIDTTLSFFSHAHNWFRTLHNGTRAFELMESDFKSLYKSLSPKYLNPNKTGFKKFLKTYRIGNIKEFKSNV